MPLRTPESDARAQNCSTFSPSPAPACCNAKIRPRTAHANRTRGVCTEIFDITLRMVSLAKTQHGVHDSSSDWEKLVIFRSMGKYSTKILPQCPRGLLHMPAGLLEWY